ncbi:unnamed protein product [Cylicocyclus nassatus]|uniref:Arf-GAP domain-containing protein n=1 Tax=Cylicocyclus nassatus TaxID=53992 RepID=A0AA36MI77_CYLNA|nr:unnamed protein product [Cylicocyclus nassatus]
MVNAPHASSGSTLSAQKKRQDEKNLRALRELASLPANRFCFECGQRGPTYVNVTHGSFCCTSCSGILRGLNPPHRVKSISMANFTNEEIERVRSLGNEENSHTWLGLYSGNPPKMTNKDEITAFLIKKYEKKEWFVSRSELEEQERLLNQAKEVASQSGASMKSGGSASSKPPELDLFATDPFAAFGPPITRPSAVQQLTETPPIQATSSIPAQPFSPPAFTAPPPPLPSKSPASSSSFPQVSNPFDSAAPKNVVSAVDPFADFDAKFSELALKNSSTVGTFGSPLPPQPLPKSATVNSALHTQLPASAQPTNPFKNEMPPMAQPLNTQPKSDPVPICSTSNDADKYSALAELDQMFHHGSNPSLPSGDKPAWLPSGFSTGLPPSHHTPAFDSQPKIASNPYGSIPKSNTFGAIAEVGATPIPPNPVSFDNIQQQAFSNSFANLAPNPFLVQSFGSTTAPPGNFMATNAPRYPQAPNPWNNPFSPGVAKPYYGADPMRSVSETPHQQSNQNWNPFV